jgi:zinc finger HIT domain-containing protein 1
MPHIEVLQTAASAPAPGWAYVVDRAIDPSKTALNPSGSRKNKRAVRSTVASATAADGTELTRREQVAIQRRLAELDKDAPSGAIEVPQKWRGLNGGGGSYGMEKSKGKSVAGGGKITTNVRRVLLSEKTFLHHLADEEALRALASQQPGVSARTVLAHAKKAEQQQQMTESRRASVAGSGTGVGAMLPPPTPTSVTPGADVEMQDAPPSQLPSAASITTQYNTSDANNALLQTSIPPLPTPEELEALLSAPALPYSAARAAPPLPPSKGGPPQRHFCEMCGYLGRVRCLKCGARVCGLECKEVHDIDCRKKFS